MLLPFNIIRRQTDSIAELMFRVSLYFTWLVGCERMIDGRMFMVDSAKTYNSTNQLFTRVLGSRNKDIHLVS